MVNPLGWLPGRFGASLGYMKPCLKKTKSVLGPSHPSHVSVSSTFNVLLLQRNAKEGPELELKLQRCPRGHGAPGWKHQAAPGVKPAGQTRRKWFAYFSYASQSLSQ